MTGGTSRPGTAPEAAPAAFLDRDGTVIIDRHFLSDPEQLELVPGAAAALRRLQDAGYRLVIVTNQSGIGRGHFGETEYRAVHARLVEVLEREHVTLAGTYHCPHAPGDQSCDCRKPSPVLYERAARELGVDPSRSLFIGDRWRDVAAALHFGGRGILVRSPRTPAEDVAHAASDAEIAADLSAAIALVLGPTGH
jgi:histidinol-phosphate phosphatase family protein